MTRVAVLMPYYRHPARLLRSLNSLGAEKENFTLYLIDDGNIPALEINPSDYPFPIRLLRLEKNSGIVVALNTGLEQIMADGFDFVARLDAGDNWVAGRLAAQQEFLLVNRDYGLVGSCASAFNADGLQSNWNVPLTDHKIRQFINFNSAFIHPSVMMRVSIIKQAGLYSNQFEAAEDYEYFRRLLTFTKAANLSEQWLAYELGIPGQSISIDQYRTQIKSVIKAQLKYFDPLNWQSYAGLVYKILNLYAAPVAILLKKLFRKFAI